MTFFDILYDSSYNISIFQVSVATVFFLYFFYYNFWRYHGVPPGPWGMPLLGYWPFINSEEIHVQFQKQKEKYGDISSFSAAGELYICLNSAKLVKEAHLSKSDYFGDRFDGYSLLTVSFEEAVSMVNGESWKVQRKFFQQKFKEFGLLAVKENFSGSLYDTLKETVEEIGALKGEPFPVAELLTVKCSIIIRRILFNDQGITKEELHELNREYEAVISSMTPKNLLLIGNVARYLIFPFMPSYWAMMRSHKNIRKILENIIDRHKQNFDENQVLDIIDCFYKEKLDRERKGDPTAKHFTDKALLSSVYQFVTDGALTIAFFIGVILEKLVEYPEEQEKIYKELSDVLGSDRQPTMEDKSKLPYTNAFIYEVIRFSNFIALFASLKCTKETTIRGYRIPKGAITVLNLWSAHHDPSTYEEPERFMPSRFVTVPGKPKAELPIMFGVGKRACMGEALTMMETFLFIATIVKNFQLTIPGDARLSSFFEVGQMKFCANPRNAPK